MPLDESSSITYALYDFNTEEFIGYTYGGQFYVDGNTVTKPEPAAIRPPAMRLHPTLHPSARLSSPMSRPARSSFAT